MDVLREFEDSEREIQALREGLDGKGGGSGEEGPDEQRAEVEHVPSYIIQERSVNRLAARQTFIGQQIQNCKLHDFYGELEQLLQAGNAVIEAARVSNYYSTAFVGRNNLGKSTVLQTLLLLGTVSQDQYEDLMRAGDEPLEAQLLVQEWKEKERRRRLEEQQHGGGAGGQAGPAGDHEEEEDGDGDMQEIQPEPNDHFFVSDPDPKLDGRMQDAGARAAEETGQHKYLKVQKKSTNATRTKNLTSMTNVKLSQSLITHHTVLRGQRKGGDPRLPAVRAAAPLLAQAHHVPLHQVPLLQHLPRARRLLHAGRGAAVFKKYAWPKNAAEEKMLGDDETRELKFMELLLKILESGGEAPSADAAVTKANAEGGAGDVKGETAHKKACNRAIAQMREKATKAPRKDPANIKIHSDVADLLKNPYKLFVGRGQHVLDDRVYIRTELGELLDGPFCALIKDVCVFAPCLLLEGKLELVDTPGLNDCDPFRARNINKQLRCSDHLVVFAERNLSGEGSTLTALQEQQIFDRLFHDTLRPGRGELRLSVLLLPERETQLSGNQICSADMWGMKSLEQESAINEAVVTLMERLTAAAQARFGDDADDLMDRVEAQVIKIKVVPCYPMLYLSAMLNVGYKWEQPQARNLLLERTQGAELLALLGNPTQEQHLEGMQGLYDLAAQKQELLQQRQGHTLPDAVCRQAKTLVGRGNVVLRENRFTAIEQAIQGQARFQSTDALFLPGSPTSVIAQALGGALKRGVEAATDSLLNQMRARVDGVTELAAGRTLRGYLRRQDCSAGLLQIILEHQSQSVEGVKGRKQALSEQIKAVREGLEGCVKEELERHLVETFATTIDLNSPDGERYVRVGSIQHVRELCASRSQYMHLLHKCTD